MVGYCSGTWFASIAARSPDQSGGSEVLLDHRVLPTAIIVDARGDGPDPPLDGGVLLSQAGACPQDVPDS